MAQIKYLIFLISSLMRPFALVETLAIIYLMIPEGSVVTTAVLCS